MRIPASNVSCGSSTSFKLLFKFQLTTGGASEK